MCTFYDHNCHLISYEQVRSLMTEPFPMSLVGEDAKAVTEAVNQGIDAHLEACFCPERGDVFEPGQRTTASGAVITTTLECVVSAESMPVLLRRLFEAGDETGIAGSILDILRRDY